MRKTLVTAAVAALMFAGTVSAKNEVFKFSVQKALSSPTYKERLGDQVRFQFGDHNNAAGAKNLGEFITNKKTNATGKSELFACEWALLSALLQLQQRALDLGGNAVVDIVSYYDKKPFNSDTQFECHVGFLMAGVALKGTVVQSGR